MNWCIYLIYLPSILLCTITNNPSLFRIWDKLIFELPSQVSCNMYMVTIYDNKLMCKGHLLIACISAIHVSNIYLFCLFVVDVVASDLAVILICWHRGPADQHLPHVSLGLQRDALLHDGAFTHQQNKPILYITYFHSSTFEFHYFLEV